MSEAQALDLLERVNKGAALFDYVRPAWWQEVDLADLDMSRSSFCVVGQLWGAFSTGLQEMEEMLGDDGEVGPIAHGFEVATDHDEYARLDEVWALVINGRRLEESLNG